MHFIEQLPPKAEDQMSSEITITDGVAQLIEEMQRDIENGKIRLSANDWAELASKLEDARGLLEKREMGEKELDDATWMIIAAFEENKSLMKEFGKRLKVLTGGTKLTSRKRAGNKRRLLKNKKVFLTFIKKVGQKKDETRNA